MVGKLARFLRLGLRADRRDKSRSSLELDLQRSYLDIEQLRYPDLTVEIEIQEPPEGALVPSLILQPIIENAVKYGASACPATGHRRDPCILSASEQLTAGSDR